MKKVLIGIVVLIVLLLVTMVSVPFLFKDKINATIKEEINSSLNAKVDYGDFDLSLFKSFPNFSFSLNNLTVAGIDSFKGDTLANIKNFNFTIDLMSVIGGGKIKLIGLHIVQPTIDAIVTKGEKSNWDIVKPSSSKADTSAGSGKFSLMIKDYSITDGNITYDDKQGGTFASIKALNFEGSGDVSQDLYTFLTKTNIEELTVGSGKITYLSKAKVESKLDIDVDQKNSKYTFKDDEITLNALGLSFTGFVAMPKEGMNMDLSFKSTKAEFKSILSLIPAVFKKDFDKVKTSGTLALDGHIKGAMKGESYPSIYLNLKVDNAMFQYPSLPTAVNNINIAANITKPEGKLDATVIDISKLHLEAGKEPIDAHIHITNPVSDPDVEAVMKGSVNLGDVPSFYPMPDVKTIAGNMKMNLDFKARMSAVNKKQYENIHASGDATITNLIYDSKESPMPIKVTDIKMTFNPKEVTLNSFDAVLGKTDLKASGVLDNMMGYLFSKGSLVGRLNLVSNQIDANEFLKADAKSTTATTTTTKTAAAPTYFKVPANIDFTTDAKVGTLLYDNLVLKNVHGNVVVREEALRLNDLDAQLLGGNAIITGDYITKDLKQPKVDFSYTLQNMDIQQSFQALSTMKKMAPVTQFLLGTFGSGMKMNFALKPDMSMDMNSLTGDGKVEIPYAKLQELPIIQKITEVTKINPLQNLEMKNASANMHIKDGRVNVDPTDIKFTNGTAMNISGSNGLDGSLDYNVRMDIPSSQLGNGASTLTNMIPKVPGIEFKMPETLNVTLKVTGEMTKPSVKILNVAGIGSNIKDAVINTAKQKAEDEAKKLLNSKNPQDAVDKLKGIFKF